MGASGREPGRDGGRAGYEIEGSLLEACQCGVLCPCWLGEDPDEGDCRVVLAFHLRDGHVGGLDVSGLTVVQVVYAPGNLFAPGSWRVVRLIDERAGGAQRAALLRLFRGELGGPLSALASLVDREVAVESAPIHHSVVQGQGRLAVPGLVEAVVEPFRGPDGTVTTLRDSRFSMAPGAPAWVAQAVRHRVSIPRYGMVWDFAGRNAIQLECTWRSHDG
ncbi:MAG: DUF1326 domain-containing protein [Actinomycetota bacterium]